MIAVIFEVWPANGHKQTYLDIAASLRPELKKIDGFLSIDMSLAKRFTMPWKESHSLQFRGEVFNVPNIVRFDVNTASLDVGNTGTFGKYSSLLTNPRVMQFGMRYDF